MLDEVADLEVVAAVVGAADPPVALDELVDATAAAPASELSADPDPAEEQPANTNAATAASAAAER